MVIAMVLNCCDRHQEDNNEDNEEKVVDVTNYS